MVRGRRCRSRAADAVPEHQQLNPLQSKAAPVVLDTDRHLLVVAPTGAGETVRSDPVLRAIKLEGRRAAWLVPARVLAGDGGRLRTQWQDLSVWFVELTGEDDLDSDSLRRADLWIRATEKFEALYRRGSLATAVTDLGCLVVDEVHLVGDPTRGPTLEALLARLRLGQEQSAVQRGQRMERWSRAVSTATAEVLRGRARSSPRQDISEV